MTIPTKNFVLNSQRGSKPKVDPIRIPQQSQQSQQLSANHSRYLNYNIGK